MDLTVLFGSDARGESSQESDINTVVAFDETVDQDEHLAARIDRFVDLFACL